MKQAIGFVLALCLSTTSANCQDREPVIGELGGSVSKSLKDGSSGYGPSIGIEFTPIKEWLEVEMDVTPLMGSHSTDWTFDVLFKKPFTISRKIEFMAGLGPELSYSKTDNTVFGLEIAADVMYWPFKRIGFFIEPAYDIDFAKGNNQSIGVSGGLLIPFK
ncbi:hypothetical protein [Puia dinghuensis]|uniref:Outer membrane protein beta-barrel domain-containing protein n=1 Tax=Puia dinghuensis TaxID=1792502 RepID=A0A8J2UI11_9BACT|nr:hypothetical protein [Puia dinghuensis]GGB20944.1 hypothetical protein GCM10011511_50890 [Puia dinghuensis]